MTADWHNLIEGLNRGNWYHESWRRHPWPTNHDYMVAINSTLMLYLIRVGTTFNCWRVLNLTSPALTRRLPLAWDWIMEHRYQRLILYLHGESPLHWAFLQLGVLTVIIEFMEWTLSKSGYEMFKQTTGWYGTGSWSNLLSILRRCFIQVNSEGFFFTSINTRKYCLTMLTTTMNYCPTEYYVQGDQPFLPIAFETFARANV